MCTDSFGYNSTINRSLRPLQNRGANTRTYTSAPKPDKMVPHWMMNAALSAHVASQTQDMLKVARYICRIWTIHAVKVGYYMYTCRDIWCWAVTSGHKCCIWRQADSWQFADSWAEDNYRDQHLQSAGAVTERGFTSYYNGDTAMVIGCIYMATLAPHGDEYIYRDKTPH